MLNSFILAIATVSMASAILSGCAATKETTRTSSATTTTNATPTLGLPVGAKVPNATLQTIDKRATSLAKILNGKTTVITFYRGGWCPYCNAALVEWHKVHADITAQGAQFIAITTEKPDDANRTVEKNGLDFDVLVDHELNASRAFAVLFDVAPETKELYLSKYNLDVAKFNASGTWQLPHPGTFIVDSKGIVRYAHVDADYAKGRDKPANVIAALKAMKDQAR